MIDTSSDTIRYMTTRVVRVDEELCIFYGHTLWFDPVESTPAIEKAIDISTEDNQAPDELDMLHNLSFSEINDDPKNPFIEGYRKDLIEDVDLPIIRISVTPEEEEDSEEKFMTSV